MTAIAFMRELADGVMPSVVEDYATLYPSAPPLAWSVSTRARGEHGAPPRVQWVPGPRDDFQAPQKRSLGGSSRQRSLATRQAGVQCQCWGADADATEALMECLVRHLLLKGGVGDVGITLVGATWVDETGASTYGESCTVFFTFPVDVRASVSPGPATVAVTPVLDQTPTTSGDGFVDAGDP